ncbi:MAG: GAF domain-containing protein, partial [Cyanobacteria bacterium J06632_22]
MVTPDRRQRKNASKPKLLVVDDEPDNLDLLYRTFYRQFKVLRAEGGQAALDTLAEHADIAVVISDQRMPGMSGTELLRLCAEQYPNTMRIMLTGYTDVEDLVDAINEGKVFKYVTKPWEEEDLRGIVDQAVDTHRVLFARTQELNRVLRQETLLNAITTTIRSAQTSQEMLQTIVETLGEALEVDYCIIQPIYATESVSAFFTYVAHPEVESASGAVTTPREVAHQLTQTVWETDELVVLEDIEAADALVTTSQRSACSALGIRASAMVPLVCKHDLMAMLALHTCDQPRSWDESEQRLLSTLANQAALALSQTWTYERVQALAQREVLINTITQAIHHSLEPKQTFAAITQKLGQALQADGCALSLWTESDEFVECVGLYDAHQPIGIDQSLPQSKVPIAENPILQTLLFTLAPVVLDNLDERPKMASHDLPLQSSAKALLVMPLMAEGKIIGSISLRQVSQPRRWQSEEINLAQAVANQAAIAVQQARLYQTTRQQAEQLMASDQQKTAFFQNISHEFRTPLTLTIGPLESAVSQNQGLDLEQSTMALRNSRRLLRLVNQLLDLQRLDAGRMQAMFRPCDLAEFVHEVVGPFQSYCDRKQLNLISDLADCPTVYLDLEKFD